MVGENFAFFLPVMMAAFSIAFLLVWRWGAPEASYWSLGYAFAACGFAIPLLVDNDHPGYWPLIADTLFASGFLAFATALLHRWRARWMLPLSIGIWAGSLLICAWAAGTRNLLLELIASDIGCFLLISIPLVAGAKLLGQRRDRTLFVAICLVAFDNIFRAATVTLTIADDGSVRFIESGYAFLMQAFASLFGLFMGLAALAATVTDMIARLRHDANVDPLSGLLNRRGFDHAISPQPAVTTPHNRSQAKRQSTPPGCIITCDIDHFKQVNDGHGHAMGDRVIAALAAMIRTALPSGGVAARFGGEEFIIFLPRVDTGPAARLADHIRLDFETRLQTETGLDVPLSASFGIAGTTPSDFSLHDTIARADSALYDAKRAGRNRVVIWQAPDMPQEQRPAVRHHPFPQTLLSNGPQAFDQH